MREPNHARLGRSHVPPHSDTFREKRLVTASEIGFDFVSLLDTLYSISGPLGSPNEFLKASLQILVNIQYG
jgi:hypothetical protein